MSLLFHRDLAEARSRLVVFGLVIIALSAVLLAVRFLLVTDDQGVIPDFHVYYKSSRWVVENGVLYRDFASEYPLFANLWFAIPRFLGALIDANLYVFSSVYVLLVGLIYGGFFFHAGRHLEIERGRLEILALLIALISPGVVQLVLLRFDFLPALLIFYALFFLRNKSWPIASLLLGAAIAAKGYPLVYVPAWLIFVWNRFQMRAALMSTLLVILPSVAFLLVTLGFAGYEGMVSPFLFHARRTFDSDSLYSLFSTFAEHDTLHIAMTWAVRAGTAVLAVLGAVFVNGSLRQLARLLALQTFGLLLLSPISSPQFIIWAIPFVYFAYAPGLSALFCGFALFSNLWVIREFGIPTLLSSALGMTSLAFRIWLFFQSVRLVLKRSDPLWR